MAVAACEDIEQSTDGDDVAEDEDVKAERLMLQAGACHSLGDASAKSLFSGSLRCF